jgi:hypothetical protein
MKKSQKTRQELEAMIRQRLGNAQIQYLQVGPDATYGWSVTVMAAPSLVGKYQHEAEQIASELRGQFDLKS